MDQSSPTLADPCAAQYGALCWRLRGGRVEVLLITSREQGRWVIPKGWPIKGCAPHKSAAREAWEEAGVKGKAKPEKLGQYSYPKDLGSAGVLPCAVQVYTLAVEKVKKSFPEAAQRRRKWFTPEDAANRVAEPELREILSGFVPVDVKQ